MVLVRFPFSDLSATKLRPALVLANSGRGDWICAQITSKPYADPNAVTLGTEDLSGGDLNRTSYVRPSKLFTASEMLFQRSVGQMIEEKRLAVVDTIISLLRGNN
ncbi:MAG TPA: type II toxin-antitoxin system PemK/MazF family toxin [Gammaproteobacteria bacterium]|nr:type II toxin-antitoxin system PemK/MazF family toxin [Gammaproteobacteria bacterium]